MFNISYRKVGGLRFLKIGRFTLMFCQSAEYKPLKAATKLPAVSTRNLEIGLATTRELRYN
jgi:hypothetical protein